MSGLQHRLPLELLELIVTLVAETLYVEGQLPELSRLRYVSRTVRDWVTPLLYKTVHIESNEAWDSFRFAVVQCEHPATNSNGHPMVPFDSPARFVQHLSAISWKCMPSPSDFRHVLTHLPNLSYVQVPLALVPHLPPRSTHPNLRRVFVSKYGPTLDAPPAAGSGAGLTHLFFEPFYTGLYPTDMRLSFPLAFPDLSHFGILYVSAGDAVLRDLLALIRSVLALPAMRRVYVRVYAPGAQDAFSDADAVRAACAVLNDPRVFVGEADGTEWTWKPGAKDCTPVSGVWGADARGTFDQWNHGVPAWTPEDTEAE